MTNEIIAPDTDEELTFEQLAHLFSVWFKPCKEPCEEEPLHEEIFL